MTTEHPVHEIVIVGGGAGGMVRASRLGDTPGKGTRVNIINSPAG
jgi:NADH dehydrogenase FAD-containing subunit